MRVYNPIRFRVLLPVLFLALSVALGRLGDAERNRIVECVGKGAVHGIPDWTARARYLDYALNAPAWAAAWNMPAIPLKQRTYWEDIAWIVERCSYPFFVVLMWLVIGFGVDRWRETRQMHEPERPAWRDNVRIACAVCGGFILCSAIQAAGFQDLFGGYEIWFLAGVFAWAIGLIFAAVHPYSPARSRIWRLFFGILGTLVGGLSCWFALILYSFWLPIPVLSSSPVAVSSPVAIFVWGSLLISGGVHLLVPKRARNPATR
jgi:hypothetical protein